MKPRIMRAAARPTAKAEPANFVGTVLSDPVFAPEGPSRLRASRVSFMPGGRTNWHKHAVGQVLYVLSGRSFMCSRASVATSSKASRCRRSGRATPW